MSQDVFQRKLNEAYQGIDNVCGIADIIAGETPQGHDTAMVKMLEASRKSSISLNSEKVQVTFYKVYKLQFKQHTVDFYGHRLTDV